MREKLTSNSSPEDETLSSSFSRLFLNPFDLSRRSPVIGRRRRRNRRFPGINYGLTPLNTRPL